MLSSPCPGSTCVDYDFADFSILSEPKLYQFKKTGWKELKLLIFQSLNIIWSDSIAVKPAR